MQFQDDLAGGVTLVRPALQSPNYAAGTAGWQIAVDGSAEFSDVTLRGNGVGDTVVVGPNGGPQVVIGQTAANGYLRIPVHSPKEGFISEITGVVFNPGTPTEYISLQLRGPAVTDAADRLEVLLDSQNDNATSQANLVIRLGNTGEALATLDKAVGLTVTRPVRINPVSGSTVPMYINAPLGQSANLMQVAVANTPMLTVDWSGNTSIAGNANVTGTLTAGNIQHGSASITTTAGTWTSTNVTFPTPFATMPHVVTMPNNFGPGLGSTTNLQTSVSSVSTTGFVLFANRTNVVTMNVAWLAIA